MRGLSNGKPNWRTEKLLSWILQWFGHRTKKGDVVRDSLNGKLCYTSCLNIPICFDYTHEHTQTHARADTKRQTRVHAYSARAHTHMYTCTRMYLRTHTGVHICTRSHTHAHTRMQQISTYARTSAHTQALARTCARTHTHINTPTRFHMQKQQVESLVMFCDFFVYNFCQKIWNRVDCQRSKNVACYGYIYCRLFMMLSQIEPEQWYF